MASSGPTPEEAHRPTGDEVAAWKRRVLVISGPTGVGKSAIAEKLVAELGGKAEIVSADSVQVYKGMDIGSNKPTAEEQAAVRYHLVDLMEPLEEYSAADFAEAAATTIADILARGNLPIVVGGTGFYIQWLLFGRPEAPPPSDSAALQAKQEIEGFAGDWGEAVKRGIQFDPEYVGKLNRNDWFRLQRVLEVWFTCGKALSEFERKHGKQLAPEEVAPLLAHNPLDFRCFFLHKPRVELFADIDKRCEVMLYRGFLHEVWRLVLRGQLAVADKGSRSSERSIGYRQALDYLQSVRVALRAARSAGEEVSRAQHDLLLLEFLRAFQAASRQFVRRQLMWFRSDPLFRWTQATTPPDHPQARILSELCLPQPAFLALYSDPPHALAQEEARQSESGKQEQRALKQYLTQLTIYHSQESREVLLDQLEEQGVFAALAKEEEPGRSTAARESSAD